MLSGQAYQASDPELVEERARAGKVSASMTGCRFSEGIIRVLPWILFHRAGL